MDTLGGHPIHQVDGSWRYADTGEPTAGNRRPCGHCGLPDTPEGHDGCLGTIPDVMNACCGHGDTRDAYVQYWDGTSIHGGPALEKMRVIREKQLLTFRTIRNTTPVSDAKQMRTDITMAEIRLHGDQIDEVVAKGHIHLEQLDDNCWMLNIDDGETRTMLRLFAPYKLFKPRVECFVFAQEPTH